MAQGKCRRRCASKLGLLGCALHALLAVRAPHCRALDTKDRGEPTAHLLRAPCPASIPRCYPMLCQHVRCSLLLHQQRRPPATAHCRGCLLRCLLKQERDSKFRLLCLPRALPQGSRNRLSLGVPAGSPFEQGFNMPAANRSLIAFSWAQPETDHVSGIDKIN